MDLIGTLALIAATTASAADLHAVLNDERTTQDVPGVSAVVTWQDEVLFAGGSGVADIETGEEMSPDTVLYAGSLSKILTAVLALQLVHRGDLSLDQAVPGIAGGHSGITVSRLLTHSSGLEREGDFGYWFNAEFPGDAALAAYLESTELRSAPGAQVRYSNIGFAALGLVIAEASGASYHEALRERVLEPLGMRATGSPGPADGLARGYSPRNRMIPSEERPFAGIGRPIGDRYLREYHDARAMSPAFGAYSTANDLGRLARFLLGHGPTELLPEALLAQMLQPQKSGRSFGLGTEVREGRRLARHGGWFAAHKSHILIDPGSDIAVVVLANSDNADPDAIARRLLDVALDGGQMAD